MHLTGIELGKRICQTLGIDPMTVETVELICSATGLAQVRVTHLLPDEAAGEIQRLVAEYELQPKPPVPPPASLDPSRPLA